ncbi:PglD-related sugar-binding protein [Butyrivibrio sp. XPD2002]|uniref:PglD-related sugar-binding protein n=1 Tax=Butyrivibrio sp. XPD2002 TaxID=1280665 RepID=UPI000410F29B|nr:hypothetical protein [Butyrivibrio sp. XPD2002]
MRLIILGAGGYGRTIADLAEQCQIYKKIEFMDDNLIMPSVVGKIGDFEKYIDDDTAFYPAIGDNRIRCELIREIDLAKGYVMSLVHKTAYISPTAKIGKGVVVMPNASIGTNAVIGDGCIVNMNAIIDHDCILGAGVHIAPGAILKGENRVESYTKIESGVVIERGKI